MVVLTNPGSDEAIALGCTCPVLDNNYGRGYYEDGKVFVTSDDCPYHVVKPRKTETPKTTQKPLY